MKELKTPGKKIKILFITGILDNRGGAEKNFFEIVLHIDRSQFTPYVLVFRGGKLANCLIDHGVPVEENGVTKLFSLYAWKKGYKLYRFLKKEEIEVVITYHHDPDIWGGMIARLARVPVVISSRRDMGYQLQKVHVWFYRIFHVLFSSYITVSDAVKRQIAQREWQAPRKMEVIHNGVSLDLYPKKNPPLADKIKSDFNIDTSKVIIGMLAAFRPVKGHLSLVEAVGEIVKKNRNIQVILVGNKETEPYLSFFQTVKNRIDELGLQDHFLCLGYQQDALKLLSVFDILVVPAVSEGFSNAILEAMAMEKPVVASDSGGNPEAVEHQKTGLLFKAGDSRSLADALYQLIGDSNLRRAMGKQARRRVEKYFQLKHMVERNEELYRYHLYKPGLKERLALWTESMKINRIKKSVKIMLSHLFFYSGIIQLSKRRNEAKDVKVLAYHSINKITLGPLEIEQEPQNFKQQMLFLKKNYHVLSLSEFIQCMKNGQKYPDNSVLITFDDGYKDNYINAYPVLKKLSLPAVIFLTTDPVEKNIPLFYDSLRYAILNTKRKTLDLHDWGLRLYALYNSELYLKEIICEITDYSKTLSRRRQLEFTDVIFDRLLLDKKSLLSQKLYLDWNEIKEMASSGIEFGAHTMSHPSLGKTSLEQIKKELVESKKLIETRTGKEVVSFAYPFGSSHDYSSTLPDILDENGFECAFMLTPESRSRYWIGRKCVDSHMTAKFNGTFCKPLFACEMANIFS